MAVKEELKVKRGCGFRKVGGLYLVGRPFGSMCDRLPFRLRPCPMCEHEHKFNRGLMQVTGVGIFHTKDFLSAEGRIEYHNKTGEWRDLCFCREDCPACRPDSKVAGIMWVGKKFYTPASFAQEAINFGVSKRIPYVPEWLKVGETWVFLAHPEAVEVCPETCIGCDGKLFKHVPGVFLAFVPQRIEAILSESDAATYSEEDIEEHEKRGLYFCTVPDDDPDHR